MGYFLTFGRWIRISKIRVPADKVDYVLSTIHSETIEQALYYESVEIYSGLLPNQTIWANAWEDFDTEQYYDLFMPSEFSELSLPDSTDGECLVFEQSTHGWAVSGITEMFDPNDLVVEWFNIKMPSGLALKIGRPSYGGEPLEVIWPPFRAFEDGTNEAVPNNMFGIYPRLKKPENDMFGRSIAPEYPDCAFEIMSWRNAPRLQNLWVASNGHWAPTELVIVSDIPYIWPDDAFPSHPATVVFRKRLDQLYRSLQNVGIFGEDLADSWGAGQLGSDVFDHIEARMSELGPILGIADWKEASVCWSGTYVGEDEQREDDLSAKYDPDGRVEDMTDRIRNDLITLSEPITSTSIYFECAKRAKYTATEIAEHIVRLAPAAQLETSWNGDSKSSISVWLADPSLSDGA